MVDKGARLGGCEYFAGELRCTHPTERYDQSLVALDDGRVVLFGGFSRDCEDYCSDQWEMDAAGCRAAQQTADSGLRQALAAEKCPWKSLGQLERAGPGRRWRHAVATDGARVYVFGGHRLWHGFSPENSEANRWQSASTRPYGGYLDDLWEYTPNATLGAAGTWRQIAPRESCFHRRGVEHVARFDIRCTVIWPRPRAGASMTTTLSRDIAAGAGGASGLSLLLFGGFRTPFPFPHRRSRGAGTATSRSAADGLSPYPDAPYYLGDLWRFNVSAGLWAEVAPLSAAAPSARRDAVLTMSSASSALLFGGYSSNFLNRDLWIFNDTTTRWLRVESHVHALFPPNCTADTLRLPDGSDFVVQQSVFGEPTRGTDLDGSAGRAASPVQIRQPRRQAPGWDGCRDRADGRSDLPPALQYEAPSQRELAAAVFSLARGELLVYGGRAALQEGLPATTLTPASAVVGDMWLWRDSNCPKNCSDRGACVAGHCYCYDGYYGVDCSNVSCPGDFCYMDHDTHTQVCTHCCSASWAHADGQSYALRERKVPCDAAHPGQSHGICDGFGSCQCQPPFLTEDCSVRDCPNGCNGRGFCSVEFPVSRCQCDPGWIGADCSKRLCLNNCSYPNGDCISGVCNCSYMLNPYNRSMLWARFQGEDCSYVVPYAAAALQGPSGLILAIALLAAAAAAADAQRALRVVLPR